MRTILVAGGMLLGVALPASARTTRDSLPEGTVQISPVVPAMGGHWAREADRPLGPICCVHEGKVVRIEYMIDQADLAAGESWSGLAGMEGLPPADHMTITSMPEGHPGHEVSHYDLQLYVLPPEEIAAIR